MKILAAGATGFIGRSLLLRLQRDGHEVTRKRRQALVESRVNLTDQIVRAMAEAPVRPQVFISSSGVAPLPGLAARQGVA